MPNLSPPEVAVPFFGTFDTAVAVEALIALLVVLQCNRVLELVIELIAKTVGEVDGTTEVFEVLLDLGPAAAAAVVIAGTVPLASRYQFDFGSPMHSPTVTARYPLC